MNFTENEVLDAIRIKYDPTEMPKVFFKELKLPQDYKHRSFARKANESFKAWVYQNPTKADKVNIVIPGAKSHYEIPKTLLPELNKFKDVCLYSFKKLDLRLVKDLKGFRIFIPKWRMERKCILDLAKKQFGAGTYSAVPRIFGNEGSSSIFWDVARRVCDKRSAGKDKVSIEHFYLNVYTGEFRRNTYYPCEFIITVSTNQKSVLWKKVSFRQKNGELFISFK